MCICRCNDVYESVMIQAVESSGRLDNWKELLLDLFYVIFLIKLGNIFLSCDLNSSGYLFAISHFLGVYMAKFELDQYLNKFGQRDLGHNLFLLVYAFGLFISILNINSTEEVRAVLRWFFKRLLTWQWSERNGIDSVSCPGYRLYEYGYYSGWLIIRGAFLIMYSLIGYFVKPQGVYSFITKAPTFLTSNKTITWSSLSTLGIVVISFSFKWSGDFDDHHYHSSFVLAAALVEYLGYVVEIFFHH